MPVAYYGGAALASGTKTVAAAGTAEPLSETSVPLHRGVYVKALADNTGDIYVGGSDVDNTGYFLDAGEDVLVPTGDLASVYIDVGMNDDGVKYLAS